MPAIRTSRMNVDELKVVLLEVQDHEGPPSSTRDQIYYSLRRAIMFGTLAPGTALTLRGVAEVFGTSPMPAREAIMRLVDEGGVTLDASRSFSVVKLKPAEADEVRRIRVLLEGEAIEVAADKINEEVLQRIMFYNSRLETYQGVSNRMFHMYNYDFHFAAYRASRMPHLVEVIESLWLKYSPNLALFEGGSAMARGVKIHRSIIAALERHDGPAAREALVADINSAAESLRSNIKKMFADEAVGP